MKNNTLLTSAQHVNKRLRRFGAIVVMALAGLMPFSAQACCHHHTVIVHRAYAHPFAPWWGVAAMGAIAASALAQRAPVVAPNVVTRCYTEYDRFGPYQRCVREMVG